MLRFKSRGTGGVNDLSRNAPPGGFVIDWPFGGPPGIATIDGQRQKPQGQRLQVPAGAHRILWQPAR